MTRSKELNKKSLLSRLHSIKHAINGLNIMVVGGVNFQIHLFTTLSVVIAGIIFEISAIEWLIIILSIGFVIALEVINTSIEHLSDFVSPERNQQIKKVKDLAAAAVLVAAFTTIVVGLIIFVPKILTFLKA